MSEPAPEFDLKFLPDWLKEAPAANRYADYEGEAGDRPRRDRDDRRGPPPRGDRRPERRETRPPGRDRPPGPRPAGGGERPRGDRRGERRPPEGRRDDRRHDAPRPEPAAAPAELRVEFLPEPNAAAGIAKQIKSSGRAYAVFGTAKLFLERPERHRVRLISSKPQAPLFQVGDGPVSFDRATVERGAFHYAKDEYYAEETIQGEPVKGNFTNVARSRTTGALLGPTNHHGYQPALRKLYEERFARRMSFQEFQQTDIETVSGEQVVADWKEQARTSTTFTTTKEAEPITFKTAFDAEQHFRKTYLPQLVKSGTTLECSGPASRAQLDRHVSSAVRRVWEQERVFPQGIVNGLRRYFNEVGLHYFKHRKRVLHISGIKPLRHAADQPFSDSITGILAAVEAQPRIKRPDLAKRLLGENHDAPEVAVRKAQLAADVHYLVHMGHLIEFADGAFELPLGPKSEQEPERERRTPARGPAVASVSGDLAAATPPAAVEEELETVESLATPEEVTADTALPVEDESEAAEATLLAEPLPIISDLVAEAPSAEPAELPNALTVDAQPAAFAAASPVAEELLPGQIASPSSAENFASAQEEPPAREAERTGVVRSS